MLVLSALASVIFLSRGAATVRYTHDNPRHENVFYLFDADTGKSVWLNLNLHPGSPPDAPVDDWAAQYVSRTPEKTVSGDYFALRGRFPLFQHDAPILPLEPPDARLVEDSTQDGRRTMRLLLRSARHARELQLVAESKGAAVSLVAVNGKPVEQSRVIIRKLGAGTPAASSARPSALHRVFLNYFGAPDAGLEVTLEMEAPNPPNTAAPVLVKLFDYSDGLPEIPGQSFRPRPANISMQHFADMTMDSKSYSF